MVLQTRGESKIKYSKIGKISKLNLFRNSDRKSEDFQSETNVRDGREKFETAKLG